MPVTPHRNPNSVTVSGCYAPPELYPLMYTGAATSKHPSVTLKRLQCIQSQWITNLPQTSWTVVPVQYPCSHRSYLREIAEFYFILLHATGEQHKAGFPVLMLCSYRNRRDFLRCPQRARWLAQPFAVFIPKAFWSSARGGAYLCDLSP